MVYILDAGESKVRIFSRRLKWQWSTWKTIFWVQASSTSSTMPDEINQNQLLDRHTFIDEESCFFERYLVRHDQWRRELCWGTYPWEHKSDRKIPEGYAVSSSYLFMFSVSFYMIAALGYHLEPSTVISALAKNNITTVELVLRAYPQSFSSTNSLRWIFFYSQLPNTALARMKEQWITPTT